jgi:hypothetical protein
MIIVFACYLCGKAINIEIDEGLEYVILCDECIKKLCPPYD